MWSAMPRPRDRNWCSRPGARQEPDCAGYSANGRPISYRIAPLAPVAQWIERPPPKGQVGRSIRLRGTKPVNDLGAFGSLASPAPSHSHHSEVSRTATASVAKAKIRISLSANRRRPQQRGLDCASRPSKAPRRAECWRRRWRRTPCARKRTACPSRRCCCCCVQYCRQWRPP